MQKLNQQIFELLDEDKKELHKIYARWIKDHAYLWTDEEIKDLEKLRELLLVIIKLFYHEHKQLRDLGQVDYDEFKKDVRQLLSNHHALLKKARKAQIEEIEFFGLERWFEMFRRNIENLNDIITRHEQQASGQFAGSGTSSLTSEALTSLRTLEQFAHVFARFIPIVQQEASSDVSGSSDADIDSRLKSLKKSIEEDNALLSSAFQDLYRGSGKTEPDFAILSRAANFFERKAAYDRNTTDAVSLQQEYQKKLLGAHNFTDIYKLRQVLDAKRRERQNLEGTWFSKGNKQKLDKEIETLDVVSKKYDAVNIAQLSFDIAALQRIAIDQSIRLLRHYDAILNQILQVPSPQLMDLLVQDYTQNNFVLREGYRTSRGHQVFASLPADMQTKIKERANKEFGRLAFFTSRIKYGTIVDHLIESQKRSAQTFSAAIEELEARIRGRDDTYTQREGLKQNIHDILRKEPYEGYLQRFIADGITPEIWITFSRRREIIDMYGINDLERFKEKVGTIIWEELLINPKGSGGAVSALALTPLVKTPYLVMNFWAQRNDRGESWAMREIVDVLSSFSEEEMKLIERLNVPGLIDVMRTVRSGPKTHGDIDMQTTEEAARITDGMVRMCEHYMRNGNLKEKYFALKTAPNLKCFMLTGSDHIADPRLTKQREILIPAISEIVKIPEAVLKEPRGVRKLIPEIGFYFKFEDFQAGKGYQARN